MAKKAPPVFQLHVALDEIEPLIWRRLEVPGDITLAKFHYVLQDAFGWTNSHLHAFAIGDARYGMVDADESDDALEDEKRVRLHDVVTLRSRFAYEYDFGDSWNHTIKVEKAIVADPSVKYPRCLGGARACPPEDVGGAHSYMEFVEAIVDPTHERHDEFIDWIGEGFDPTTFDLKATNEALWASRTERLTRRAMRK